MTAETHPSLESLAAFADGRLSEGDRRPVVAHLADCEECYELVAETLQVQEELEEEEGEDPVGADSLGPHSTEEEDPAERETKVAPFSREPESGERRTLRSRLPGARFLLVAATVALASLAGVWLWNALQPRNLADQVAALELPPAWSSYEFNADYRNVPTQDEIADAVRAGARFLDLQTALARKDSAAAANALAWLQSSAEGGGKNFLADDTYEAVQAALAQEDFPAAKEVLRQRTPIQDQMLKDRGVEGYFALGVWAEAGRLAALAGDLDFLSSERFQQRRPTEVPERLPGQRSQRLKEQLTALEKPLAEADLPAIARRFEEILNLSPAGSEETP